MLSNPYDNCKRKILIKKASKKEMKMLRPIAHLPKKIEISVKNDIYMLSRPVLPCLAPSHLYLEKG